MKIRNLKLGTQLNLAFFIALFVPLVVAIVYSIVYYSEKIQQEALNKISSDLKLASLIYRSKVQEMENLARSYAQQPLVALFGLGINEKLGNQLAKDAQKNALDMVFVLNQEHVVMARSHQPTQFNDTFSSVFLESALNGQFASGTEVLSVEEVVREGFSLPPGTQKVLVLTGSAPLYDRQQQNITGALLVRRLLNGNRALVQEIHEILSVDTAIFESATPIATNISPEDLTSRSLQTLNPLILERVLTHAQTFEEALIHSDGYLAKYAPLMNVDNKPIGMLMVRASAQSYLETRFTAIISLIVIGGIGFLLAYSIKVIIQRQILGPIGNLREGTDILSAGNYSHQIPITSEDEIGELGQAFNHMALELKASYEKLEEYNRSLEAKVEERTALLTEANQKLHITLETLNPGVSHLIAQNKQHLGLTVATEFITDLVGYTRLNMTIGERLIGDFMTQFFRESHKLLAKYFGFRDKTIGDQIVATFGIPKDHSPPSPFHPFDAIFCGLKMQESVSLINQKLRITIQEHYSEIVTRLMKFSKEDRESVNLEKLGFQIRIGINTSNPATGREIDQMRMVMMGAETGVDYTGQGGALIYASRLESNGSPGEIHIGENTRKAVEHVFELEELPTVQLKGLGIQTRYRVLGTKSLFGAIYPQTRFYQRFFQQTPEILIWALKNLIVGWLSIPEVQRIEARMTVSMHYLEHIGGVYKLTYARALFAYALAEELQLTEEVKMALIFATIWHNRPQPQMDCFRFVEHLELEPQLPIHVNKALVNQILEALSQPASSDQMLEAQIVEVATRFDQAVFDRTYLRVRQSELISAREAIEQLRQTAIYPPTLTNALESLMMPMNEKTIVLEPQKIKDFDGLWWV